MSRAITVIALGIVFILGGAALFALGLRRKAAAEGDKAPRKSDLRDLEIEEQNNQKLRLAGGIIAAFGALLAIVAGTT